MNNKPDDSNAVNHVSLIHFPDSWLRLVNVIKHQASEGRYIFIEGPHLSGKSTFAETLLKKLSIVDDLTASYQKLHPLSSTQQVLTAIPDSSDLLSVVILDDADEVDSPVLEELISTNLEHFFVILGEPDLVNRVPRLKDSGFILPLFNKADCQKLLNKLYHTIDPSIEVPALESELVYYESRGYPGEVIKAGLKLKDKLSRSSSGLKSFDIANKGLFSTAILAVGFIIFLVYLFWPNSSETNDELGSLEVGGQRIEQSDRTEDSNNITGSLEVASDENQRVISENQETGELSLGLEVKSKELTFDSWVAQQNPEHFTIQLFSNSSGSVAEQFKKNLDLADSYIYQSKVQGNETYRVIWGVYPNRARAQLAVKSLPNDILEQKPWLRSFKAISDELANSN